MTLPFKIYLAEDGHAVTPATTDTHSATPAAETHATTGTPAHAEPAGGIGAIGVDPKALAFQLINFAILLFILKKVAYKPILKVLNDRHKKIADSLKHAEEIDRAREEMALEQTRLIKEARDEADTILNRARTEAAESIKDAEVKAGAKSEQILTDAQARIESDVAAAKQTLKKELAGLVVSATGAIIDEKLDVDKDHALLDKALAGSK